MARFLRVTRLTLNIGLALLLIGMAGLLVLAWIEYLMHPGLSISATLAIRREPWTTLADWCVLAGSLVALMAGGVVTLAIGSWIRRILVLPALALPAYWWLTALGGLPAPGFHPPDPIGLERMLPLTAAITLLLPAAIMAALAISPRKERPAASRMRPVHETTEDRSR
jgi:hypothetical protein